MERAFQVFFFLIIGVAAQVFAADSSPKKASHKSEPFNIDKCTEKKDCQFFIMGSGFKHPKMALNIPRTIWEHLADPERQQLEAMLKEHVVNARKEPDAYTNRFARIPRTAPAFKYMSSNVATVDGYTIYLADEKHPERGEWLIGSELFTKKF